jgi:hypothetical protein
MWMPPGSKRMQQTAEQLQLMQQNISGIITTSGSKFLTGALSKYCRVIQSSI